MRKPDKLMQETIDRLKQVEKLDKVSIEVKEQKNGFFKTKIKAHAKKKDFFVQKIGASLQASLKQASSALQNQFRHKLGRAKPWRLTHDFSRDLPLEL